MNSFVNSEIFLPDGTLSLNAVNAISFAKYYSRQNKDQILPVQALKNPMIEEATHFAQIILHPADPFWGEKYEEWTELARNVSEILYEMRKSAGIVFLADNKQ